MRTHAIGTGPFKFVEFKPNEYIRVVNNPDYWKSGRPYRDGVGDDWPIGWSCEAVPLERVAAINGVRVRLSNDTLTSEVRGHATGGDVNRTGV